MVSDGLVLRPPTLNDGLSINRLISRCPPLDENSIYCNLLQASHFASTSVLAEQDDELLGFVSGYRLPQSPNVLFIWQVAVASESRGVGLGQRLIINLLNRLVVDGVDTINTSITPTNRASWALFQRISEILGTNLVSSEWMDSTTHFAEKSPSEALVVIGPYSANQIRHLSNNENL